MMQVLSMYPLTDAYRRQLEARVGQPLRPRVVGEFRRPGLWDTWKALGTLKAEPLVLASEDPTARAVTALLITVGGFFGRGPIRLFDHDLDEHRPSRLQVPAGLWRVLRDSLRARWLNRRLLRELHADRQAWKPVAWDGGRRVAYLKTNLWFGVKAGGSVGHVAGVINGLHDDGQQVEVYANEPQPLVQEGVPFLSIHTPSLCAYPSEMNLVAYQEAFTKQARERFRKGPPDWIYQRLSTANFTGAALSREHGLPLVVEYNGSEVWIAKNWGRGMRNEGFALAAEEAMLRQASLVVAVSEVLGDELRSRGIPEERIFVHPNCVDPAMFRPDLLTQEEVRAQRARLGIASDAIVCTFLGTFGPWHGVVFMADALKRLYRESGSWLEERGVHFLMVGDGAQRAEVERALAGLPRITFTGLVPQAEAPRYLAISDLLLSPHVHAQSDMKFFGSPTKLFEYMAMGKAILASELEQIGEILSPALRSDAEAEAATAYLFRPGDQEGFLKGLRRLLDSRQLRDALGPRARARVLREYTWDRYASRLLQRLEAIGR